MSQHITQMLLCEAGAVGFFAAGVWFKGGGYLGLQIACYLFGVKWALYGVAALFHPTTPTRGSDE